MNQERDLGIGHEMVGFAGGGVRGHDNRRVRVERSRGEVGIGHERNVRSEAVACCQMKLKSVNLMATRVK